MKIVRIIARLNVGGPARHVVWLTEALQDDDFRSVLIAGRVPPGEDDMAYFAADHGVEPVYIQEMSREISISDLSSLIKLFRRIRSERPDIIHTHTAKAGTLGRTAGFLYRWATLRTILGRPKKVKIVHTFHGHVFHSYYGPVKTRLFISIEKLLARLVTDRIIVLSEQLLDEIHGKFGIGRREQFSVVPLGIDLSNFGPLDESRRSFRKLVKASDRDVVVGYVGRLTEIKNLDLLIKVAAEVRDRPDVRFAIVGDGHLRQDLEAKVRSLDLEGTVTFLGNRSDIADVYNGLDIVAITSLNEGTPLSLIEGMAAGKSVISTAVGGVPDLVGETMEDRQAFAVHCRGVLVRSFDPLDFANGLKHLADDEKLRAKIGESGREFVNASYSKERLINDIKSLYRELAAEQFAARMK
jgi:glycosyltransferase involved in cell wall biosynthesis